MGDSGPSTLQDLLNELCFFLSFIAVPDKHPPQLLSVVNLSTAGPLGENIAQWKSGFLLYYINVVAQQSTKC
jgi:hypothetical protein